MRRALTSCWRCLLAAVAFAACTIPLHAQDHAEGKNWKLIIEATSDGAVVKAVPKANPSAAAKLCETASAPTTRVFLSADDDVAVVESGSASLGTSLSVFLLTEGTEFLEVNDWDVNEALDQARKKAGGKEAAKSAAHFVAWSADGKAALLSWGNGNGAWYAVADFDTHKISTSLERLNRKPKN